MAHTGLETGVAQRMIYSQKRFWMHTPLGVIAPLLVLTHDEFGGVFCGGFLLATLVYQVVQGGKPHVDIQGIIGGIPIGCTAVYIVRLWF